MAESIDTGFDMSVSRAFACHAGHWNRSIVSVWTYYIDLSFSPSLSLCMSPDRVQARNKCSTRHLDEKDKTTITTHGCGHIGCCFRSNTKTGCCFRSKNKLVGLLSIGSELYVRNACLSCTHLWLFCPFCLDALVHWAVLCHAEYWS